MTNKNKLQDSSNFSYIIDAILEKSDFNYFDKAYYFPKLLNNPTELLSWNDIEYCINNPAFYEFEFVNNDSKKVVVDRYPTRWVDKLVQDSYQMSSCINSGYTFILLNYAFHNRNTQEFLKVFEDAFSVDTAIHVYGGLQGSKSFKIHDDYPSNFIFQVDGSTNWRVYKNRASSLYEPSGYRNFDVNNTELLEIDIEVVLDPGDALYIPSRAYHCAMPKSKRISMSIPCWPRSSGAVRTSDRNFYKIKY